MDIRKWKTRVQGVDDRRESKRKWSMKKEKWGHGEKNGDENMQRKHYCWEFFSILNKNLNMT